MPPSVTDTLADASGGADVPAGQSNGCANTSDIAAENADEDLFFCAAQGDDLAPLFITALSKVTKGVKLMNLPRWHRPASALGGLDLLRAELLDVDVLERDHLDVLGEAGRSVHVPHPGVGHRHLEVHVAGLGPRLDVDLVAQVEAPSVSTTYLKMPTTSRYSR